MRKIVFFGSPEFAVPSLIALAQEYQIAAVVTQPDRPVGRGKQVQPPEVKAAAMELGLRILQPERFGDEAFLHQLVELQADAFIVSAYGKIFKKNILLLPPYGCINIHPSLLPKWRGPSPIQAPLLHGEELTGVTIMKMNEGMDSGPILSQKVVEISPNEGAVSLSSRLAKEGTKLLLESLPAWFEGEITPIEQDHAAATYTKIIEKSDGRLRWEDTPQQVIQKIRAYEPWPGVFMEWNGLPLKILQAEEGDAPEVKPESRLIIGQQPAIALNRGVLVLKLVQPAGKKPMTGEEFLRGARGWATI